MEAHLDALPSEVGLALLQDEKVGKNEQERVTGNVESLPPETVLDAVGLPEKLGDVADARVVLDGEEEAGGKVPDAGGQEQSNGLSSELLFRATGRRVAGDGDEGADDKQGPAPRVLDEVGVEEVVAVGEKAGALLAEVADDTENEGSSLEIIVNIY